MELNDSLKEVNFGDWEGLLWEQIDRDLIEQWAQQPTRFEFPGGESLLAFEQRVTGIFSQLKTLPEDTCVFTHGGVIRLMLALAENQSWESQLQRPVPFASVTEVKIHRNQSIK